MCHVYSSGKEHTSREIHNAVQSSFIPRPLTRKGGVAIPFPGISRFQFVCFLIACAVYAKTILDTASNQKIRGRKAWEQG